MTEASASPLRSEPSPYIQVWVESLAQVLGQIAGSALPWVALAEAPAELVPSGEGEPPGDEVMTRDLWIVGVCSGGLRGEMSLRLPAAAVLRLAQIFMSEPSAPAAGVTAEHREAAVEL